MITATKFFTTTETVSYTHLDVYKRQTISGFGIFYPDKTPTQRIGIQPDIYVESTTEVLNLAMTQSGVVRCV